MSQSVSAGIHVRKDRLVFHPLLELRATNVFVLKGDLVVIVSRSSKPPVHSAGGDILYVDRVTVTHIKGLIQAVTKRPASVSAR